MMIRPTERIRCVKKQPSFLIPAQTYEEFKRIVQKQYENYDIVFTGIKARINPFSRFRMKLTWKKISGAPFKQQIGRSIRPGLNNQFQDAHKQTFSEC